MKYDYENKTLTYANTEVRHSDGSTNASKSKKDKQIIIFDKLKLIKKR